MNNIAVVITIGLSLISGNCFAGTDTMINFTNMSPYKVTVSFPSGKETCWHDTGADNSDNMSTYFANYSANTPSDTSYQAYLTAFKQSYGITDWLKIKSFNMDNTSAILNPAVPGQKVSSALFYGEDSAALFAGCKDADSSREFDLTFMDQSGNQVATRRYTIQNPAGSQWTLNMLDGNSNVVNSITLGSGGQTSVLSVSLDVITGVVTVVSLGSATAEISSMTAATLYAFGSLGVEVTLEDGTVTTIGNMLARAIIWQGGKAILTTALTNGALTVVNDNTQPSSDQPVDAKTTFADLPFNQSSTIQALPGLPDKDKLSICIYNTNSWYVLGNYECHLVGINLTILPDGTLQYLPLPSIGSGS